MATVLACGGFAAICGSSVATAATFSAVAYPGDAPLRLSAVVSTGVIAAGGTLGAMLPPSTVLAVYAVITEQDIGKLFAAGIIPGLLAMTMYVLTIALIGGVGREAAAAASRGPGASGARPEDVWPSLVLFIFVIGGLYSAASSRRPRPAAWAPAAPSLGVIRRKLDREKILASLLQATAPRRPCSRC